jgi:putative sporulation protein YyaC
MVKRIHPNSKILVVDAALGKSSEIGYVKVLDGGIKPGLGVKKDLPLMGDCSIIAIVGEYAANFYTLSGNERFNLIYLMGLDIARAINLAYNN